MMIEPFSSLIWQLVGSTPDTGSRRTLQDALDEVEARRIEEFKRAGGMYRGLAHYQEHLNKQRREREGRSDDGSTG